MLNTVLNTAEELKLSPIAAKLIAMVYSLQISEVTEWLSLTHWSKTTDIDKNILQKVHQKLSDLQLV